MTSENFTVEDVWTAARAEFAGSSTDSPAPAPRPRGSLRGKRGEK